MAVDFQWMSRSGSPGTYSRRRSNSARSSVRPDPREDDHFGRPAGGERLREQAENVAGDDGRRAERRRAACAVGHLVVDAAVADDRIDRRVAVEAGRERVGDGGRKRPVGVDIERDGARLAGETVVGRDAFDAGRRGAPDLHRADDEADGDRDDDGVERPRAVGDGVGDADDHDRDGDPAAEREPHRYHSTGTVSSARSTTSRPERSSVVRTRWTQTLRTSRWTSSGTT